MSISTKLKIYDTLNSLFKQKYSLLNSVKGVDFSTFSIINSVNSPSPLEKFSIYGDSFSLPILIKGRLITSGNYTDSNLGEFVIEPEQLRKTLNKWIGVKLFKHHGIFEGMMTGKDVPIDGVAGVITKTEWDSSNGAIDFFAEIYDADVAFKITKNLIDSISAGFSRDVEKENGVWVMKNIEPKESSLVFKPRDKQAKFIPIKKV